MGSANSEMIPWARRWVPSTRESHEGGASLGSSKAVDWEQLPCVVLLGEPGSGKSTEIRRAVQDARSQVVTVLLDLREFGDETRLETAWSVQVQQRLSEDERQSVTVFLDSLDEGALQLKTTIDLLSRLIEETARDWPSRLRVRVGCRTGAWSASLERSLADAFYRGTSPPSWVLELADLDDDDLRVFMEASGLPKDFERAIDRAGASVFAGRPVTLSLLRTLFQRHSDLPRSRWELYQRALKTLCVVPNERLREKGLLPLPDEIQQLECAATLASIVAFSGRSVIATGPLTDDRACIRIADVFPDERARRLADTLTRHTPLFHPAGSGGTFAFTHRTYAEFLAVWLTEQRGVPDDEVLELVRGADGKVIPELAEVAGWLAARRPAVMDALIESEPEVLLHGDPAHLDEDLQLRILAGALTRLDDHRLPVRAGTLAASLQRLSRHVLVRGLQEWWKARPRAGGERGIFDALLVIRDAHLNELLPLVEQVILDESAPSDDRNFAAHVLLQLDAPRAAAVFTPFLSPLPNGKPHPLLARALEAAGASLSPAEFFAAVDKLPRRDAIGSSTWHFLTYTLVSIVAERGWQAEGLRWLGRIGPRDHEHPLSLRGFAQVVWRWASEAEHDERVLDALVEVTIRFAKAHTSLQGREPEVVGPSASLKRKLAERLLHDPTAGDGHSPVAFRTTWLYSTDDLPWLLEAHRTAEEAATRDRVRTALRAIVDLDDLRCINAMFEAGERDSELVAECRWFFGSAPIEAGEHHRIERERDQKRERELERIGDPRDRVLRALDAAQSAPNVWFHVLRELSLRPGNTHYGDWAGSEVQVLPGWQAADEATRARIVECARRFLDEVPPPAASGWLTKSEFPAVLLAGIAAADLLFSMGSAERGFGVSAKGWSRWMPALVKLGGSARDWPKWNASLQALPSAAKRNVARTVTKIIEARQENEMGKVALLDRVARLDALHGPKVAQALRDILDRGGLPAKVDSAAFAALATISADAATAVALGRLEAPEHKGGACRHLLVGGDQPARARVLGILAQDAALLEEVVGGLASERMYGLREPPSAWPGGMDTNEVEALYRVLAARYPPRKSGRASGARFIGPKDHLADLRDHLPWLLADRGTRDSVAVLRDLVDWGAGRVPPIDLRDALTLAEQNLRRNEWKPKSVRELAALFRGKRRAVQKSARGATSAQASTIEERPMPELAPVDTSLEDIFVAGGPARWNHVETQEERRLRAWLAGTRPVAVVHGPTLAGKSVMVTAAIGNAPNVKRIDANRDEEQEEIDAILKASLRGNGILVIENYHLLRKDRHTALFGQLRSLIDDAPGRYRVVIAGRSVAPPDSVMDEVFSRTAPIEVPALRGTEECAQLLSLGATAANLEFADITTLAKLSGGSLNVAQRVGLNAAHRRGVYQVLPEMRRIDLPEADLAAVENAVVTAFYGRLVRLMLSVRDSAVCDEVSASLAVNLVFLSFWVARSNGRAPWDAIAQLAPGVDLQAFITSVRAKQRGATWELSAAFDDHGLEVHEAPFYAIAGRMNWSELKRRLGASVTEEGGGFILEGALPSLHPHADPADPAAIVSEAEPAWEASAAALESKENFLTWMGESVLANRGFPRVLELRDELSKAGRALIDQLLRDQLIFEHFDGTRRYRFGRKAIPAMRADVAERMLLLLREYPAVFRRLWKRYHGSEIDVKNEQWPTGPVEPGLLLAVAAGEGFMVVRWQEDRASAVVLREEIRDADEATWPMDPTGPASETALPPELVDARARTQYNGPMTNTDRAVINFLAERYGGRAEAAGFWARCGGSEAEVRGDDPRTIWTHLWRSAAAGVGVRQAEVVMIGLEECPGSRPLLKWCQSRAQPGLSAALSAVLKAVNERDEPLTAAELEAVIAQVFGELPDVTADLVALDTAAVSVASQLPQNTRTRAQGALETAKQTLSAGAMGVWKATVEAACKALITGLIAAQ